MECYRNGGCGPYEMYSCSECPASKPEYLTRNNMVENTKVVSLEVTGVPSGDYEASCIDVSKEEFERLNGFKPDEFDESCFYKNLFRYYGVEIPNKYIEEFGRNAILKLKVTYEIEKVGEAEEK